MQNLILAIMMLCSKETGMSEMDCYVIYLDCVDNTEIENQSHLDRDMMCLNAMASNLVED